MKKYLLPLFFISGFTGLTYEVIWQKQLILILGASAPAVTAVLTAFFLGIAAGGKAGDWLLLKFGAPLRLYALAEGAIAFWALLLPAVFGGLASFYVSAAPSFNGYTAFLFRFFGSALLLLPATAAMGATIPLMSAALAEDGDNGVRLAYGVNAAGGMAGALAAGFALVSMLGVTGALRAVVLVNAAAAFSAWLLSRGLAYSPRPAAKDAGFRLRAAYFVCGFVALGAEVVWLRVASMYAMSGSLVFALTLFFCLAGFAAGSLLLHPLLARRMDAARETALLCLFSAVSMLLTVPLVKLAPALIDAVVNGARFGLSSRSVLLAESYPVFAVAFLPSVFMGAVFPAASRLTDRVGGLYFSGNLGSAAGALVLGLALVPAAGLSGALSILCLLALSVPLLLPGKKPQWLGLASVAAAAAALVYAASAKPFVNSTAQLLREGAEFLEISRGRAVSRIMSLRAGLSATVTVREDLDTGARKLFVDEQQVAATDPLNVIDSKMLAHIPLLLHPAPKSALTVGYGSGGTSWSMTRYPVEVRAVEIEPEVLFAAGFFGYGKVLSEPRFRVYLNDARDLLATVRERYDVISTDVTNFQYKQNASLYTVDYFKLMKGRLNPGGIACAWIPLSAIEPAELKTLVASFRAVFPHAALWHMHHLPTSFGILTGTEERLKVDFSRVSAGMAEREVNGDLKKVWADSPEQFPAFLLLDEDGLAEYSRGAPLHTDDRPVLEYSLPTGSFRLFASFAVNLSELLRQPAPKAAELLKNYPPAAARGVEKQAAAAAYWRAAIVDENRAISARTDAERQAALVAAVQNAEKALAIVPTEVGQAHLFEIVAKLPPGSN